MIGGLENKAVSAKQGVLSALGALDSAALQQRMTLKDALLQQKAKLEAVIAEWQSDLDAVNGTLKHLDSMPEIERALSALGKTLP